MLIAEKINPPAYSESKSTGNGISCTAATSTMLGTMSQTSVSKSPTPSEKPIANNVYPSEKSPLPEEENKKEEVIK
jgi:hypothetical protein